MYRRFRDEWSGLDTFLTAMKVGVVVVLALMLAVACLAVWGVPE